MRDDLVLQISGAKTFVKECTCIYTGNDDSSPIITDSDSLAENLTESEPIPFFSINTLYLSQNFV